MKQYLWIWILVMGCLTACQNLTGTAPKPVVETSTNAETTDGTDASDSSTPLELQTESPEGSPEIADGYQLAEMLGICTPGNPTIYQMDPSKEAEMENEYGKIRLVHALYQDKLLLIETIMEDHSITLISGNEIADLPKEERERYFCIDTEDNLYGRSLLQDMIDEKEALRGRHLSSGILYPPGITEKGYRFPSTTTNTSYVEDDSGYYAVIKSQLRLRGVPFTQEELEESFTLQMNGFEEPFSIHFEKAKEVSSLSQLDGITKQDDLTFYATGRFDGDELEVCCYGIQKDGHLIMPVSTALALSISDQTDNTSHVLFPDRISSGIDIKHFSGIAPSGARLYRFKIPEGQSVDEAKLIINKISMTTEEKSEVYTIPIPEVSQELDFQITFADSTLYLTKVERMQDGVVTGYDESGGQIWEPGIYLTAHTETSSENYQTGIVYALYADETADTESPDHFPKGLIGPETNEKPWYESELEGYKIAYESEDEAVEILFWRPFYLRNVELILPVTICY